MNHSTTLGAYQLGFQRRFVGPCMTGVMITLMTVAIVTVSDAHASPQPADSGSEPLTERPGLKTLSTKTTTVLGDADQVVIVTQLASDDVEQMADVNAYEQNDSGEKDSSEVVRITESVENGVLVVRWTDISKPYQLVLYCGHNSPWPCDPVWEVYGPAEGFHKKERWGFHPPLFKFHPKEDFTYVPKRDWVYHPKKDFTYTAKRDWRYHRKRRSSIHLPLDSLLESPFLDFRLERR